MESMCLAGGYVKWCDHFEKVMQLLEKVNVELFYDSAIQLPGELNHMSKQKLTHKCF